MEKGGEDVDSWAEEAVRELEVDLKRLELDGEAKRTALERAQSDYEAVMAEQTTVRRMLEWAAKKLPVQDVSVEAKLAPVRLTVRTPTHWQHAAAEQPTQTDLAVQALKQLNGRANTAEIRERLEEAGYQYNQTQVRSALKYLAKKKNSPVEATGAGEWRLRNDAEQAPGEIVPAEIVPAEIAPAVNGIRIGGSL